MGGGRLHGSYNMCHACALTLCLQKGNVELEGREKDVKKALALVKQRWSKSKGECRVAGGHVIVM